MEDEELSFRNIPDSLEVSRIKADGKMRDALTLRLDPSLNPEGQNLDSDPENLIEDDYNESHINNDFVSVILPPRPNPLEKWDSCLVGYFIDKGVAFNYIRNSAFSLWKNKGHKEVLTNEEGFIFFIFESPNYCSEVLEGGPSYIGGFHLILKKWSRMMRLTKDKIQKVPVWVKFFNVSMEYWDSDGLSRIASAVGVPLFMDHLTNKGTRVSFAIICVELDASAKEPPSFPIYCGEDQVIAKVEYQGLPVKCEHCLVFGHDTTKCVTTQVAKLVNLQKETENNSNPRWSIVKSKVKEKWEN
ncbi:uncharacterized protein LOC114320860 [Camellia sinensis]|uniref:uncharacterized protein LOC114320860 n=1 Tax=Camellia sinensis TaxID=4442 RepID=UPI001036B755|nr:uncharacterized protein LOC114320860 [Camellia sinensis]